MRTLYIECNMGAAGDMLMAALSELHPDPDGFVRQMNELGLNGVTVVKEPSVKCGITGTHMRVTVNGTDELSEDVPADGHEHHHHHAHGHDHDDGHEHHHRHLFHRHHHDHDHAHTHDHEHGHTHDHEHGHHHHHHHHHSHSDMGTVSARIDALPVSDKVKQDVRAVYALIAEAESHAHGQPVEQVHFHEVGALDALADITGVCLLMEALAPEKVVVSPIHVGSGQVRCAHGVLPVPVPATEYLLRGVPSYGGTVRGELCTPTGAALLRHFGMEFGAMPAMAVEKTGYGMGNKDFETANCVRVMLGKTVDEAAGRAMPGKTVDDAAGRAMPEQSAEKTAEADVPVKDEVTAGEMAVLSCNLDDMTGEEIGFAMERLLEAGAPDVWTQAIGMKKNRPAVMLNVLCRPEQKVALLRLLFLHTTTLGIRETKCTRYALSRELVKKETALGSVQIKKAAGAGVQKQKTEYEDLARIAKEKGMSLSQVREQIEK